MNCEARKEASTRAKYGLMLSRVFEPYVTSTKKCAPSIQSSHTCYPALLLPVVHATGAIASSYKAYE